MNYAVNVPDHVERVDAYVSAANARIKANAVKGRRKRFLAVEDNAAVVERLHAALYITRTCGVNGDYCHDYNCPAAGYVADGPNAEAPAPAPAGCGRTWEQQNGRAPSFLWKMEAALEEWGTLTPGQLAAVTSSLDKAEQRKVERAAEQAAKAATSAHVGQIGERRNFALTCVRTFEYDTMYGHTYGYVCDDADGNVVVYKGSSRLGRALDDDGGYLPFGRGDSFTIKATVKKHDEREGVAQTVVNRPKVI